MSSFRLYSYDPYTELSAAIWASRAPVLDAAWEGDADALKAALVGCSQGAAGDGLLHAARHADPACAQIILAEWGSVLSVYHIDKSVERAAEWGNVETLAALLPYWRVNDKWREDRARRTKDEACKALLLQGREVPA